MSHFAEHLISAFETPLPLGENSSNVLRMSHRPASENAGFELALIGVAAHAVADILCR
ncbi:Ms4533A family Cys-rich leader peptide [Streptomyces sp. NPDC002537]